MSTTLIICLICKHKKIRMLVASLALHQIKEVSAIQERQILLNVQLWLT